MYCGRGDLGPRPVCRVPRFSATRWKFGSWNEGECFDHINERGPTKITFTWQVENWITKQEVETEKWHHRLASIQQTRVGGIICPTTWSSICESDLGQHTVDDWWQSPNVGWPKLSGPYNVWSLPGLQQARFMQKTQDWPLQVAMKGNEIQAHSVSLFSLAANSYMKRKQWLAIHDSILRLADNLRKYASYLD